jgi:DNA processing protein
MRRASDLARSGGRPRPRAEGAPRAWPPGFADDPEDRAALHVLLRLASLTPDRLLELAQSQPTAASCVAAVAAGRLGSAADRATAATADPREHVAAAAACEARLVAVGDPEYPSELLDLYDPPAGLFVRGRPLEAYGVRVGVVGARNGSADGREVADALGRALAMAGACVGSGAARGIDAAAHRGALAGAVERACPTVAVLGSGIDTAYPPTSRGLVGTIAIQGTVVSEYPPGTPAEPFRFPARNRIVAALSRAVVVVEGAPGSGSLITAEHALDLGREVFAVPGPVFSDLAAAPLGLIRDGATLIRGPDDLLGDLGLLATADGDDERAAALAADDDPRVPPESRPVWSALGAAASPDEIAAALGLRLSDVLPVLVGLEVEGLVSRSGGRYRRRTASAGR